MKKYFFPVITSLTIGCFMAFLLISSNDNKESIAVSKSAETIYYIQRGVYSSKESMEDNMADFEHYIYNTEGGKHYTYVGITKNKDNANKIKEYYKELGFDTYIKEKVTDNEKFLIVLGQYDDILSKTKDSGTINVICNQVLSQYEELVNNEY